MPEFIIPNQKAIEKAIKSLFELLFPSAQLFAEAEIEINQDVLQSQFSILLSGLSEKHEAVAQQLFRNLERIKKKLLMDAEFILESDPAATQLTEVIAIYPGFFAIFAYRIAHYLANLQVSLFPRMIVTLPPTASCEL